VKFISLDKPKWTQSKQKNEFKTISNRLHLLSFICALCAVLFEHLRLTAQSSALSNTAQFGSALSLVVDSSHPEHPVSLSPPSSLIHPTQGIPAPKEEAHSHRTRGAPRPSNTEPRSSQHSPESSTASRELNLSSEEDKGLRLSAMNTTG